MFKKLGSFFSDLPSSKGINPKKSKFKGHHEVFDFLSLIKGWEKIVGPRLGKTTIPLNNQYGSLIVLTNHPAISQTLSFMEEEIKKNIFKEFPSLKGKINRIYYQTNSAFFEKKMEEALKRGHFPNGNEESLHPYSPQFQKLKKEAESIFNEIEDEEIKNILISIYIQNVKND